MNNYPWKHFMHLVRSGLPISTAVFATSNITIQMHIECNVAHSIPLCFKQTGTGAGTQTGSTVMHVRQKGGLTLTPESFRSKPSL